MTTAVRTTQEMLDDRYGRRTSRRRRLIGWSIVAIVALGAVAALGWSTIARSLDAVDAAGTGFVVDDEHSVSISFQLSAPRERAVACALEALDEEHGVVGWRIVRYPASAEHTRAFTEGIPTVALATTGLVNSCWVE
jgi:hypothetical protein